MINGQSAAKLRMGEGSTTIETTLAKDKGVEYISNDGKGRDLQDTYIYALIDPNTQQVRYIGKTKYLNKRYNAHINDSKKSHKTNWIKSLKPLVPELFILDVCDDLSWVNLEQYWISQFKTWGFDLTNVTEGGEGSSGMKLSETHRNNISNGLKGRVVTTETRLKISQSNKGKHKSESHILNLKLSHKGKAPVTKNRFKRKIGQYLNGELIAIWDSIRDAANNYNVHESSISHCCAGRKKSIRGYMWKYLED